MEFIDLPPIGIVMFLGSGIADNIGQVEHER